MPGTNAGTGCPVSFKCAEERHDWAHMRGTVHVVCVTGKERKARGNKNIRMDTVAREYVCSCGHRGWSRHIDLSNRNWYPLVSA